MKLKKLIENAELISEGDFNGNVEVKKVTSNINLIDGSTLFVLLKGVNFNTDTIIEYIIEKRPLAIICDEDRNLKTDIPIFRTKNARKSLSLLCSAFANINYEKMKFIAVTGTNGKTTTATMIEKILNYAGIKAGFVGTGSIRIENKEISERNYSMTTPDPELLYPTLKAMESAGCSVIVMEISSHALALDKVAPIKFEYSIFTNLSGEHLDFHKSMDEYYKAKLLLFSQTQNGIFNVDDEYSARAMRDSFDKCNTTGIGVLWDAEVMARDVILDGLNGVSYIYREPRLLFKVNLALTGHYNVYNSLLALKCAISMGIKPCVAKKAIEEIDHIDGRFEIIKGAVTVIIDYAHTPIALDNLLKCVNTNKISWQKTITVFGCGGDRDKSKRPEMGKIAEKHSNFVIVTNDNPRTENETEIITDILSGMTDPQKRKVIFQRKKAIEYAISHADDGDLVLIVGKGHERYTVDKDGYHEFDEREIIREALAARKEGDRKYEDQN